MVLTLPDPEDLQIGYDQGHEGVRRHRIQRMTEEAREQGGLLSQEDLYQLLCCDVRTIRRDIRWLREKCEIVVATRGQQKDTFNFFLALCFCGERNSRHCRLQ